MSKRIETKMARLFTEVEHDYLNNKRKSGYHVGLQIQKRLLPAFADMSANRLTTAHIEAYKDKRIHKDGAARATVNIELSIIRRALKLGLERELHTNQLNVKTYSIGNSNRRTGFFEDAQYEAMLGACNPDMADILAFGRGSGWRRGEIVPLQWATNFDAGANVIRIWVSKSGKGRTLPLNACPELHELIQKRWLIRVKNCPFIFHHNGRVYNEKSFSRHWAQACGRAGIDRHFHDMRRTVVRNLTRAGVHRAIAKSITGHQTDAVFDRYDIVDESDISTGLEKLNNYRINKQRDANNHETDNMEPIYGRASNNGNNVDVSLAQSDNGQVGDANGANSDLTSALNPLEVKEKLLALQADTLVTRHFESRLGKFLYAMMDAMKGRKIT